MTEVLGYTDEWIVSPGQEVAVKVSTTASSYKSRFCRLIQGHPDPEYAPVKYEYLEEIPEMSHVARYQRCHIGSYIRVDDWRLLKVKEEHTIKVQLWAMATLTDAGHKQVMVSTFDETLNCGFLLLMAEDNKLEAWIGTELATHKFKADFEMVRNQWVYIDFTIDGTHLSLQCHTRTLGTAKRRPRYVSEWTIPKPYVHAQSPLFLASGELGGSTVGNCFNGRLDSVHISSKEQDLLDFDFYLDMSSDHVVDISDSRLSGKLVNAPTRAVKGFDWDGSEADWSKAKYGYGAIHFHEDDLDDAEWQTDFILKVPEEARSGAYAVDCYTDDGVHDFITFFVRPDRRRKSSAKTAFVLSTFTYTAYANEHMFRNTSDPLWQQVPLTDTEDLQRLLKRDDVGLAMYDLHKDGYGCVFSSTKRPVMNVRPGFIHWGFDRPREFSADLFFINFLEKEGIDYEVFTDHDINAEGLDLLEGIETLIFGSHPEYPTCKNLSVFEEFSHTGGNMMYLGGNGFYWVTANDPARPHRIEVRRGVQGCRAFELPGAEFVHSLTGEQGGLWRARGRTSNYTFGIGSAACGLGPGVGFKRTQASYDENLAWIWKGIARDDTIGAFGGGASGDEIDRYDETLGSPKGAVVLATSFQHSSLFGAFNEEIMFPMIDTMGPTCDKVRSDIVIFESEGTGLVFSVGSINWIWTMAWNNYDNNVAKMTRNVLQQCLSKPTTRSSRV